MAITGKGSSGTEEGASPGRAAEKQRRRYEQILAFIQKTGSISVETLSAELNVTVVTIRRDLDALEKQGHLSRTHGGAVSGYPMFYEPFKNDRSFTAQVERSADAKRRIGRAAAAMVGRGETIAVTPGTTTAEVIRGLPLDSQITLITNTVNIAMELSKRKDINVFVTGGNLRGDWFSLVGRTAIHSLENALIQTLFLGADGFDAQWGPSCFNQEEAELNGFMVKRARRRIAVVDHTKFSVVANWQMCEIGEIHILITDTEATDEMVAPFEERGIEVLRV